MKKLYRLKIQRWHLLTPLARMTDILDPAVLWVASISQLWLKGPERLSSKIEALWLEGEPEDR